MLTWTSRSFFSVRVLRGRTRNEKIEKTGTFGPGGLAQADELRQGSLLRNTASLYTVFKREKVQSQQKTAMDEVSRKLVKLWRTRRTQANSSVSETQHTAALGLITSVSLVRKAKFLEPKP